MATEIVIPLYGWQSVLRGESYDSLGIYLIGDGARWVEDSCAVGDYLLFVNVDYDVDRQLFVVRSTDNFRSVETIATGIYIQTDPCCFAKDNVLYVAGSMKDNPTTTYAFSIWKSTNFGETFTQIHVDTDSMFSSRTAKSSSMGFVNGYYYVVTQPQGGGSDYWRLYYSTDTVSWTAHEPLAYAPWTVVGDYQYMTIGLIEYIGSNYVGGFVKNYYSSDLTVYNGWALLPNTQSTFDNYTAYSIVKVGSTLYSINISYSVFPNVLVVRKTTDGLSWTQTDLDCSNQIKYIYYDTVNNLFVGLDDHVRISTSVNGTNWTDISTGTLTDPYWGSTVQIDFTDYPATRTKLYLNEPTLQVSNYLYKTTDDVQTITIPEPPNNTYPSNNLASPPVPRTPPRTPPPPPVNEYENSEIIYGLTIFYGDEDGDGADDTLVICGNSGCTKNPI